VLCQTCLPYRNPGPDVRVKEICVLMQIYKPTLYAYVKGTIQSGPVVVAEH